MIGSSFATTFMSTISYRDESLLDSPEEIEEEMEKHRMAMVRLKRLRNSFVPLIARMPFEILSEILSLYIATEGMEEFTFSFKPWIKVTWICHHWRTVIHSTPRIWSCLSQNFDKFDDLEFDDLFSRSKNALLQLRFDLENGRALSQRILRLLPIILPRIHVVHFIANHEVFDTLFKILTPNDDRETSHSLIRSLRLHNLGGAQSVFRIPKTFQFRDFPYLWQLNVANCELDLEAPIFTTSRLTHLALGPNLVVPSILHLLSILSKHPNIVALYLDLNGIQYTPTTQEIPTVTLSKVDSIQLFGRLSLCFDILNHVTYNSSPPLSLHMRSDGGLTEDRRQDVESHILPLVSRHYGDLKMKGHRKISSLTIHDNGTTYRIRALEGMDENQPPVCEISVNWTWFTTGTCSTTLELCSRLPLKDLRKLLLRGIELPSNSWAVLFDLMPKLEMLILCMDEVASNAAAALMPRNAVDDGQQQLLPSPENLKQAQTVPLQKLTYLEFEDVDFNAYEPNLFIDLVDLLVARRDNSYMLNRLVITGCQNFSQADFEDLKSATVTGRVDWDGAEVFNGKGRFFRPSQDELSDFHLGRLFD